MPDGPAVAPLHHHFISHNSIAFEHSGLPGQRKLVLSAEQRPSFAAYVVLFMGKNGCFGHTTTSAPGRTSTAVERLQQENRVHIAIYQATARNTRRNGADG